METVKSFFSFGKLRASIIIWIKIFFIISNHLFYKVKKVKIFVIIKENFQENEKLAGRETREREESAIEFKALIFGLEEDAKIECSF